MPKYLTNELPEEIQAVFQRAHAGDISPAEFCNILAEHRITGPMKMLYVRDAFDLPLEKAKEIVLQADHGSDEAWAKEMSRAIDELPSDS